MPELLNQVVINFVTKIEKTFAKDIGYFILTRKNLEGIKKEPVIWDLKKSVTVKISCMRHLVLKKTSHQKAGKCILSLSKFKKKCLSFSTNCTDITTRATSWSRESSWTILHLYTGKVFFIFIQRGRLTLLTAQVVNQPYYSPQMQWVAAFIWNFLSTVLSKVCLCTWFIFDYMLFSTVWKLQLWIIIELINLLCSVSQLC